MIFYALSNAAQRVLLHGPGAELEGTDFKPRPDGLMLRSVMASLH